MRIELLGSLALSPPPVFSPPILATTELINAWLRDSAHPETDVEAVFLHSRSSQRRRRPMAYGPSKRPSVDRDEPITPTQSALQHYLQASHGLLAKHALKAFKATGIAPIDPEVVLKKFRKSTLTAPPPLVNVSKATITNLINQAYDPSSIAANNLSEILLRLQAAKEIAEYEKDALRAALHVHQKPRNRHEPPLDLQQRKAFHSGAVWWSPCKLREARFRQLVKEKEKEKELLDKIELKEAKENNRIYQLKIKEAARAAREEAKKVRDEAKAVKAAELDAKRRDRDAAKAIQQPQSGKRKASKPAAKQQPKKRRVGGAGGGTLAEVAAPAPPPTTTRRGRAVNTPAKYR
ncbi:hypothetical protein PTTW11_03244 [Pyrenophora teres f. teres]|uniref:Uncharacterized protein n=1 Tax=Pyrenophora teres f. teres TaxID=97479 RepID=A0A6S6VX40_9PLEO|nr:hypothetical protein PTTW11_03244 [Pyrenophora teres f. teres]